jgi:hypothetical protein
MLPATERFRPRISHYSCNVTRSKRNSCGRRVPAGCRLGAAGVISPDVRFGHRSACGVTSVAFRSLGENVASPSGLRSVFYAGSMTRAAPSLRYWAR